MRSQNKQSVWKMMEEEILRLYQEPAIGASYANTYGEENIRNLLKKYRSLDKAGMRQMMKMVVNFSQSADLAASFVSVGVLHALGQNEGVAEAYQWAHAQKDAQRIISHFDIGKSVADYFSPLEPQARG